MTNGRAPSCPRCHGDLDGEAVNGVCKWCLFARGGIYGAIGRLSPRAEAGAVERAAADLERWKFDQHPRTTETAAPIAPIYAIGHRHASGQWCVALMRDGALIGDWTPEAARVLAFDLIQMAEACEGKHPAQVRE